MSATAHGLAMSRDNEDLAAGLRPRDYQQELMERAVERNVRNVMPMLGSSVRYLLAQAGPGHIRMENQSKAC